MCVFFGSVSAIAYDNYVKTEYKKIDDFLDRNDNTVVLSWLHIDFRSLGNLYKYKVRSEKDINDFMIFKPVVLDDKLPQWPHNWDDGYSTEWLQKWKVKRNDFQLEFISKWNSRKQEFE